MKIVIRAGGAGTRLWPWSRSDRPKQFLPMFEGRSCVQAAFRRFAEGGLARPEDVYVSVGKAHETVARQQVPELARDHFIVEPAKMDTAAAIGLETIAVAGRDHSVIIASLGSDHYVARPDAFVDALRAAETFLKKYPRYLLCIACEPVRAETNYGHIKKGKKLAKCGAFNVCQVDEFTEKPDLPTAKRYTESGQYLWNANFFVWTSAFLLDQFKEFEPKMHKTLMEMLEARGTDAWGKTVDAIYPTLKKIAIDYAVLEPAAKKGRLAVLPVAMGWSDIGSWGTLTDAFPPDAHGNLLVGPVVAKDTKDTTVYVRNPERRIVAVVGVEGLAIVDTGDALLVIPKRLSGKVKDVVEELKGDDKFGDLV